MKLLLSFFLLLAVSTFGAVPDYKSFRGTGGITIVSNPPTGTIVIDGSGVVATGTNSSIRASTNGTAVTAGATNVAYWAGTNLVVTGTNVGSTAHINYRLANDVDLPGVLTVRGQAEFADEATFNGAVVITNGATAGHVLTSDAVGVATWQAPTGGSGTAFSNKNMYYVSMTGDNSTAAQGSMALPYRDPMAAQIAAAAAGGGTVAVFPGIYTTNNLSTNGVNFYGYPGAILNYVDNGIGAGRGIFDDRGKGAVVTTIGGYFDIRYSTGLTGYNVGTAQITADPTNAIRGAICVTNPMAHFNISCASITVTTLVGTAFISALSVYNASNVTLYCPLIIDPIIGQSFFIGDDDAPSPIFKTSTMTGIWWERGQVSVVSDRIQGSGYAVYGIEPTFNAATQHLHVTANVIESFGPLHTVYLVGFSNAYKAWITAHEIVGHVANTGIIGVYGEGRYYITTQKISGKVPALYSATGNQRTWVTTQRVASTAKWVHQEGGFLDVTCGDWVDDGGMTIGWDVIGGELVLHGGDAAVLNGQGLVVGIGGKARFKGVTINTSAGNLMTNTPVLVKTNGVILHNSVLVAPTAAPGIMASGAMSVLAYNGGIGNKTNHPNITVMGGPWTVNSNVR